MTLLAQIVLLLVFFVFAYAVGLAGDGIMLKLKARPTPVYRLAFGGCLLFATGMIVCTLGSFFFPSASMCFKITSLLFVLLAAFGIFTGIRVSSTGAGSNTKMEPKDAVWIIAALIVLWQAVCVTGHDQSSIEAVRNISTATYVYDTAMLKPGDPMMLAVGVISSTWNVHPLTYLFMLCPPLNIALYYLCHMAVIERILSRRRDKLIAFAAIAALHLWGYQSEALIPATLLISWFGTWVFVIHGLLNVVAATAVACAGNRPQRDVQTEEWDMKDHRILNARNLAIALGVLALALIATVFVLNSKINRLYDATVNLQEDINGRCSVYEFAPDGGEVAGYLLKGSDGSVTFIGGGPAGNSDMLRDFLEVHGNDVRKWYLYGEEESDSGAMKELIESGYVDPEGIYVINREEITGLK